MLHLIKYRLKATGILYVLQQKKTKRKETIEALNRQNKKTKYNLSDFKMITKHFVAVKNTSQNKGIR